VVAIKRLLFLLAISMCLAGVAVAQGDLGAQIEAADAALGSNPGQIIVSSSGTISEGQVSLSAGHDLVCMNQPTISLDAGSYLYQNSNTSINNCIISSTATPINGEIQSVNTQQVQLNGVTFIGGGNLVYYSGVTNFTISDNQVTSITAAYAAAGIAQNGYYLTNCSQGSINNLVVTGFVFPAGAASYPGIIALFSSSEIAINNPSINNVDASYDFGGSGIQINGSSGITINGGTINNNAKVDGVTSQSWGSNPPSPSSNLTIKDLTTSYDGLQGLNTTAPLTLGDGLDIINTRHVRISNCTIFGSGYIGNRQPGIWLFLDDDVVVSNCQIEGNSGGGIYISGSPSVRLINNTVRNNQVDGTFTEAQIGLGTSAGSTVTWTYGVTGGFSLAWVPGTPFVFDGVTYKVTSVTDNLHIVVTPAPPSHSTPAQWEADSINEEILGGVIEDNGQGLLGGQTQVGIDWADSTTGIISGVTSINTGTGSQLWGLELDNHATAILTNDNFSGNIQGGIYASLQNSYPSSLSFGNQGLATSTPAQTVTLNAEAVEIEDLSIQITGDFSQTNNCGIRQPGYSTCQINVTFTPTAAGTRSGTLTISAAAPNPTQTISLTGTGVPEGLGLSLANGVNNFAEVQAGGTATYLLSIGGAGISGTAALSCTGAPHDTTCSLPATEAISAGSATTFTLNVKTTGPSVATLGFSNSWLTPWLFASSILVGWVFVTGGSHNKRRSLRFGLLPISLLLFFLCSCGGSRSSSVSGGTTSGSYTLMVTAQLGSKSEQLPLTLVVQ
jgi:parallel beta-helix repeat protein